MRNKISSSKLSVEIVDEIKKQVAEKHQAYKKSKDIIGSQIFNILELNCRVLYYPLGSDEVWGFYEKRKGNSFVCINTSLPYEKQIFAAAHELYHLWYDSDHDLMLSSILEETGNKDTELNELMANRFAAEFLVSETLLLQEMQTYTINADKISAKEILKMSNLFSIPYKTMARRFFEIEIINESAFNELFSLAASDVALLGVRLGYVTSTSTERVSLDNLVDMALGLYEKKLITYEKLEYVLRFSELSPKQLGVNEPESYSPPTDEELLSILEE